MRVRLPSGHWRILGRASREASRRGVPLYLVGGCVRDLLLRRQVSHDLDLVAEGDPSPLAISMARFLGAPGAQESQFGTLRVAGRIFRFDFARSREESYPSPAALPVVAPAPLEKDLFRRDFTVNAMALRLGTDPSGELIDPFGGRADLRSRLLRTLHPASFRDDPTRVFRLARYLCRLGFKCAPGVLAAVRAALSQGYVSRLSRHRLAQELLRVLEEAHPGPPLRLLKDWGCLRLLHLRLRVPASWPKGVTERLGVLALGAGEAGIPFLSSLPLGRPMASAAAEALGLARDRRSPRGPISPAVLGILRHVFPRLPARALRPLFLNGKDIQALGLEPGARYRELLDEAGRLQWKGVLRTRREALRWIGRTAFGR